MEERLLDLLRLALKYDETDIYFLLKYSEMSIGIRVDGIIHNVIAKTEDLRLINYLKYLANLDANKLDLPQTGKFELVVDGSLVSLRFSVIESFGLTSGVLRILSVKGNK